MDEDLPEDAHDAEYGVAEDQSRLIETRGHRVVEDDAEHLVEALVGVEETRLVDDGGETRRTLEETTGELPDFFYGHL